MINTNQLRAGRALLGLTQKQLAAAAKLSTVIVNRIENGETHPRTKTLGMLQQALETLGAEFLPGSGVRMRAETVQIRLYDTKDAFTLWQQEMLAMRLTTGDEALLNGVDEKKFLATDAANMLTIVAKLQQHNLRERILLRHGDRYFIATPPSVHYRWIAPELFGKIPTVTYGHKVAFIFWGLPQRILVVENPMLAETFRQQFEFLWRMAQKPPFTPREIQEIVDDNLASVAQPVRSKRKRQITHS